MKRAGIKAQIEYRNLRARKGEASIVSPNRLQRQFNLEAPDERWVTNITYIRPHEGWLYVAMVVDLFSWKVTGIVNATRPSEISVSAIAGRRGYPARRAAAHQASVAASGQSRCDPVPIYR